MIALALLAFLAPQEDDEGFLGLSPGSLSVANKSGSLRFTLSGTVDLEAYLVTETSPGLLFEDRSFANPRLTLFLETEVGERLFLFAQSRIDRGFDPGDRGEPTIRLDEWFARYTIGEEDLNVSFQAGKFATPLGNFVPRHESMKNPFVRAPLLYDHITTVGDNKAPTDNQNFIHRRDIPDKKAEWVTMIWGPVYHTGAMVFATLGKFDLRFAVTNAAPCERPEEWEPGELEFENLAFSGRAGWNPFFGFKVGLNFARGPWLRDVAEPTLAPGDDRNDFAQTLVGIDLEYNIDHFIFWAEVYVSDWDVPNVSGNVRAIGWYLEGRYKIRPGLYVSARFGQMLFNEIEDASGNDTEWERDHWRAEIGVGYFIYVNLLAKAQIEYNKTQGPEDPDDTVGSFSLTLAF